jgi:hypothetical protein
MKKIIVVRTCDGDTYYPSTRPGRERASYAAVVQILHYHLSGYEESDRESVRNAMAGGTQTDLWHALCECRAVREEYLN